VKKKREKKRELFQGFSFKTMRGDFEEKPMNLEKEGGGFKGKEWGSVQISTTKKRAKGGIRKGDEEKVGRGGEKGRRQSKQFRFRHVEEVSDSFARRGDQEKNQQEGRKKDL